MGNPVSTFGWITSQCAPRLRLYNPCSVEIKLIPLARAVCIPIGVDRSHQSNCRAAHQPRWQRTEGASALNNHQLLRSGLSFQCFVCTRSIAMWAGQTEACAGGGEVLAWGHLINLRWTRIIISTLILWISGKFTEKRTELKATVPPKCQCWGASMYIQGRKKKNRKLRRSPFLNGLPAPPNGGVCARQIWKRLDRGDEHVLFTSDVGPGIFPAEYSKLGI